MKSWNKSRCHYVVACTSFVPRYMLWLPTELGFNGMYVPLQFVPYIVWVMMDSQCVIHITKDVQKYSNLSSGLISGFAQRSGSASPDMYPNSCIHCTKCALNKAPTLFRSYYALPTMADLPASIPNSGHSTVHILSLLVAIT